MYAGMANYQRILEVGGTAKVVGDERSVRTPQQGVVDVGATECWAAVVSAGHDEGRSVRRTTEPLKDMVSSR